MIRKYCVTCPGIIAVALLFGALAVGRTGLAAEAVNRPAKVTPWLLHLPGIGGERSCDHTLIAGLKEGGVEAECEIYDWTQGEIGIAALQGHEHHMDEAQKVADMLTKQFYANPQVPIYLTAHSAGAGIATWALERLPKEVKVEVVCMFAPALSPGYDLSKALAHVNKKAYVFASPYDYVVLGTGTKAFGTVDGVKCEAAGLNGFVKPENGDAEQYRKLSPQEYNAAWGVRYGNVGGHISCMRTKFAREYVAMLMRTGAPPANANKLPTTQPAGERAGKR